MARKLRISLLSVCKVLTLAALPTCRCGTCGYHNFGTKNPVICGKCPEVRPSALTSGVEPAAAAPLGGVAPIAAAGEPALGAAVPGDHDEQSMHDLVAQQIKWHLKKN